MTRVCERGHPLGFIRFPSGDRRGCDACGSEIRSSFALHCETCDFDLCGTCAYGDSVDGARGLCQLQRACAELNELEAASEEQEAADALFLDDVKLRQVELRGHLQRYVDRKPTLEDVAGRYESEISSLAAEVLRLKEENEMQCVSASHNDEDGLRGPGARMSRSKSPRHVEMQLVEEAREIRQFHFETQRKEREVQTIEYRLECCRDDMKEVTKLLRSRERNLEDMRSRQDEVTLLLQDLRMEHLHTTQEIERERGVVQTLNRQRMLMRESCYVPAKLKKRSGALMKFLEQEGGRLNTEKFARGAQVCTKLYTAVATDASSLQALAARAKVSFDESFEKYQRHEQSHAKLLKRLHLEVTRGVLGDTEKNSSTPR